ncbi:hypothetical protein [Desulfoscipio geothermicus]|uniref:Glycosyl transferase family 2 n=1 Tax=Desulfoscipio geothermicus DSM 3669 TaxID=1121426 RepID=A0A1I6DE33_9FIRM|nr:hypothetical protein [Desulfoscipio geothermicus]SFR03657.1 hypothetical protein SAMN05660706_10970 [Desulfoscipio geothermicus DSM 3669]
MVVVYALAAMFLGWLAVMLCRTWRLVRAERRVAGAVAVACGGAGSGEGLPQRLVVLVQDQADYVEGLVRRLAALRSRQPAQRVVLVDGGSGDETALILERLARRFNMGFYRMDDGCTVPGDGQATDRYLDLRGVSGPDLLRVF